MAQLQEREQRHYRPFSVEPVVHGFIVRIGCRLVVFNDARDLAEAIGAYLTDPTETERAFLARDFKVQEPTVATGQDVLADQPIGRAERSRL